jgi:hypothetical protein
MKKTLNSILLLLALVICLSSCATPVDLGELWEDATYVEDTEFGNGETTVNVEVKAGEHSVSFTINTDKTTLGEALLEHSLIEGEDSQYGLYVKKVNGILADYDINGSYWGFYKNGEYMMSGVDSTEIADGEHYELVYTK